MKNISINSIFEIGFNRGLNFLALNQIDKSILLNGLEINNYAFNHTKNIGICNKIFNTSILNFDEKDKYDLVFTKGVLIHINPDKLDDVYQKMYELSNKYILIAEYYSRDVREINYRGNENKLFKRDFCGEIMTKFPELKLIDYGFVYYRDTVFPQDDISWFLLEK